MLSLARSIFEETSLDGLIKKIMMKAQGLLQSEKCRVYLVDHERQELEVILTYFTIYEYTLINNYCYSSRYKVALTIINVLIGIEPDYTIGSLLA